MRLDPTVNSAPQALIDNFGRRVSYLRISVTDRCDFRCVYCMSDDMTFLPREQLLTLEEIIRVGKAFIANGVDRIRITGGEPLTRRNIMKVFEELGAQEGLKDLTLTTNGSQLTRFAPQLKAAGVTRINVSLDTLREDRFSKITRTGKLSQTLEGIDAALEQGFERLKLNAVILKGRNEDEVLDLVDYSQRKGIDISFIEEMPLGVIADHDRAETYYSSDDILRDLRCAHELEAIDAKTGGPSRYYQLNNGSSRVGFISPHSHNFCEDCNRVRMTAEGRLLLCLGQEHSVDLRRVMRGNPENDVALHRALHESMNIKPKGHDFNLKDEPIIFRHMNSTGG